MGDAFITRRGKYVIIPFFIDTGLIVEFYGTEENIPDGWALCDGTNGTPDLSDEFIVCAGDLYNVGATGGSADSVLLAHNHTLEISSGGAHSHAVPRGTTSQQSPYNRILQLENLTGFTSATSSQNGSHSHTASASTDGEIATNKNLPPYLSLYYIIKLEEQN
jgi:microcystin-dependent protein